MLCGSNEVLKEVGEAIDKANEAVDSAQAAYAQAIAMIAQIQSAAANIVPLILSKIQQAGGLQADLLDLAMTNDPFEFANKLANIIKKYGPETGALLKELGWDTFPPSFSMTDICSKVDNLQEDGTVIPNDSKNPSVPPVKEEVPALEEIKKLNEFLGAVVDEVIATNAAARNEIETLKSAATDITGGN